MARNLSRWCHAIVARIYGHDVIQTLAAHASVPVINALTDWLHPCQAMADALTIMEHGDLRRDQLELRRRRQQRVSLADQSGRVPGHAAGRVRRRRATRPTRRSCARRSSAAAKRGGADPLRGRPARGGEGRGASLYTDVWASMGQESEAEPRRRVLPPVPGQRELLAARPTRVVLHCLPAHRGEEITAERARVRALDRVRPGREPPARAEGHPRVADRLRARRDSAHDAPRALNFPPQPTLDVLCWGELRTGVEAG